MRYYKDKYEIPLWNWLMIQEKGFDLKYLLKNPCKITKKKHEKLYKSYMNILNSLKTDNKLLALYTDWQILLTIHKAKHLNEKISEIKKEDYQFNVKELEQLVRDYLTELEKSFHKFEFTEFFWRPDYKEHYINLFNEEPNELLDTFKTARFFIWHQYYILMNDYPLFLIPQWKKEFIQSRIVKIDNLIELDTYLLDIMSEYGLYNDYQYIRNRLFDLNNIVCERKEKMSLFHEVAMVSRVIGHHINTKEISLAEYEGYQEEASRQPETNEPKADGGI